MPAQPQHVYTHGHHDSVLSSHRWRTAENSAGYLLPLLTGGQRLLDVGSGPGTITVDLARVVAPGETVALEQSAEVVGLTLAAAEAAGVTVTGAVGDVHELPFPDDSFDVVHAHQVLQHVADPAQALREMARVCRPGGVVAVRDADYRAFAWAPRVPALDDWMALYQRLARANGGEPDAGRFLRGWAAAAGLTDVTCSATIWCFATPQDLDYWCGMWARRVVESDLAHQAIQTGAETTEDLATMAAAFDRVRTDPGGWFTVPHGELIARV